MGDIRHTLPQGVVGPFFNDDFGDVFGIVYGFTADGFTHRELRDYVDNVRSNLISDVDLIKVEIHRRAGRGSRDRASPDGSPGWGSTTARCSRSRRAEFRPAFRHHQQRAREPLASRFRLVRKRNRHLDVPINAGGRMIRLGDIAEVSRGFVDPPASLYRVNGQPAIGLGISMREGGDVLELGGEAGKGGPSVANLPIGINTILVSNQPDVVNVAIGDFTTSLYQAVGIILVVSFLTLGVRPGAVVAIAIPVTLQPSFSSCR